LYGSSAANESGQPVVADAEIFTGLLACQDVRISRRVHLANAVMRAERRDAILLPVKSARGTKLFAY
jgi:hypothetical protein